MSSQRTKRRKIAAVVQKIVEEASLSSYELVNEIFVENNNIDESSHEEFYDNNDWLARSNDDSNNEEMEQLNPNKKSLNKDLGKWAVSYKISHNALDSLLQVLRKNGSDLPKDSRSLLHTKRKIETKYVAGDFIDEMQRFQEVGVICDKTEKAYKIKLEAVICDAPARSFVKCVKTHNEYNYCERCIQPGELYQKIVLPDLSAPLRTNIDFLNQHDSEHHNAISPFTKLNYNMVSGFPIDYMHCICLGVVRRILNLLIRGPPSSRLSQNIIAVISEKLAALRLYISKEFSRKSRSLSKFRRWKATELRLFLVYTGPVVLKGLLLPNHYQNFIDLSVAVRILLRSSLLKHYAGYAGQLLQYFVQTFEELYGRDQLVYNVHSLIHLADDAKHYGALDNCSSFKYESYRGQLKKLVRKAQSPCSQIAKRIFENADFYTCQQIHSVGFSKLHTEGPVNITLSHYLQFKQYQNKKYFMSNSVGDNCFEICGKIGIVRNILKPTATNDNAYILFEAFAYKESFFKDPCDSQKLNIYMVERTDGLYECLPLSDTVKKCLCLPYKNGFIVMPQLHY
nr:uncharacterized protein LOC124816339 [Hydra vulgaris]